MPRRSFLIQAACAAVLGAATLGAQATTIGGVDFPEGLSSFADAVVSYNPVLIGGVPTPTGRNPAAALGAPDYAGALCVDAPTCTSVSLGQGGSVTLAFTNNRLTGSGDSALDLWVFEVGADVEDTFVAISEDGITYFEVGKVFGATSGIDIDAFGFGPSSQFRFVRLTDDPLEGGNIGGDKSGADIDAVGAISSVQVGTVPVPQTAWLVALGLAGALRGRRRPAA